MATLKRNASGDYVARYRGAGGRKGRRYYVNFGDVSYADAVKRLSKLVAAAKHRSVAAGPDLTFAALAQTYLEDVGDRLSPRGKALATMIVTRHLAPFFGGMKVEQIRAADVERYRKQRRQLVRRKGAEVAEKTDKPISNATFNREWSLLRAILNHGEVTEMIERNPIRRRAVRMLPTSPRLTYFEPAEWKLFLEAAASHEELRGTVVFWKVLLLTASRVGEIAALRRSDVDFAQKTISVHQGKTNKRKVLPLTDELASLLRWTTRGKADAPIFGTPEGEPLGTAYFQTAFSRILRRADFEAEHGPLSPHSIRHSAATWARRASVPLDRIQELLGHADGRMSLRYAHVAPPDLRSGMDAISAAERGATQNGGRTVDETEGSAPRPVSVSDSREGR